MRKQRLTLHLYSVSARVHGRLRVQRDTGTAQLQHLQLGEMVDSKENLVPRIEPSWPTEEGTGQGSQFG